MLDDRAARHSLPMFFDGATSVVRAMREAGKRFWEANGILGGSAILVGLIVGLGTIGIYVSQLLRHPESEAEVASAVLTDRPPVPASTAPSPPPPVSRPAGPPAENPKPRVEPPPRPTFPVKVRLDASQARTIEGIGATVSVTFHTLEGEDITTLRVLPRGSDPVAQPFLAAGGFVDFISGGHHYRILMVAIDPDVRAVELVIDRTD